MAPSQHASAAGLRTSLIQIVSSPCHPSPGVKKANPVNDWTYSSAFWGDLQGDEDDSAELPMQLLADRSAAIRWFEVFAGSLVR